MAEPEHSASGTSEPGDFPLPGEAPPRKGLSTGTKVAIGCGIAALLAIVALIVAGVVGGIFVKGKVDEFAGGVEAQREAGETIRELEEEHPFTPPANGLVGQDRAERFFAVTDDAWQGMKGMTADLDRRSRDIERRRGDARVGDVVAGMRGVGRARVVLAEALEEHQMPASEYLWTGHTLMRAYRELDRPASESGVPAANLDLAAEYRAELAEIEETREGETGKGMVLGIAVTWGLSEGNLRALGLDTLDIR